MIFGALISTIGVKIFFSRGSTESKYAEKVHPIGLAGAFSSTFLITMLHPGVVAFYSAAFAFLKANSVRSISLETGQLAGIFLGSVSWWLFWTILFSAKGNSLYEKLRGYIIQINRLTGIILIVCGIAIIVSLL